MYEILKTYDKCMGNYFKTILYLENKLNGVMEYGKAQELFKILEMLKGNEVK